jgi:hypothetical protein
VCSTGPTNPSRTFSGPDEIELHADAVRPGVHRLAGELTTVVGRDGFRRAAQLSEAIDLLHHARSGLGPVGIRAKTLAGVLVDDRQNAKPTPIGQAIADEIHAPSLIDAHRAGQRHARVGGPFGINPFAFTVHLPDATGLAAADIRTAPGWPPTRAAAASTLTADPGGCGSGSSIA